MRIRELAAWGLDEDTFRPTSYIGDVRLARERVAGRAHFSGTSALVSLAADQLADQQRRADLREEMSGLDWSLGLIDLRHLLAFQRRIALNEDSSVPAADDWSGLIDLCFGKAKPVTCDFIQDRASLLLRSENPNLQFRFSGDLSHPITLHTGSPFFEVANYRGRWFLRDGYHRAFHCLAAQVFFLPAVIVYARSVEELGSADPWFFPEEVLFSSTPPRVADFLDDALVLQYNRSPFLKTLRITVEESFVLEGETP